MAARTVLLVPLNHCGDGGSNSSGPNGSVDGPGDDNNSAIVAGSSGCDNSTSPVGSDGDGDGDDDSDNDGGGNNSAIGSGSSSGNNGNDSDVGGGNNNSVASNDKHNVGNVGRDNNDW